MTGKQYDGGQIGEDYWTRRVSKEEILAMILKEEGDDVDRVSLDWEEEYVVVRWSSYRNTKQS